MGVFRVGITDQRPFDAIVLEMQLEGTDGISVARMIRADPLISKTPIVLVTAIGRRRADVDFFKAEGIDAFVMKPVRRAQLASALAGVVHRVAPGLSPADGGLKAAAPRGREQT